MKEKLGEVGQVIEEDEKRRAMEHLNTETSQVDVWVQFKSNGLMLWTMIWGILYNFNVLLASYERTMFLDQFVGLSIVGNMFIWVYFNILYSVKTILGKERDLSLRLDNSVHY